MTLYRALVVDVAGDPFSPEHAADPTSLLRADDDAGLLVRDGRIVERGPYADAPVAGTRRGDRRPA